MENMYETVFRNGFTFLSLLHFLDDQIDRMNPKVHSV